MTEADAETPPGSPPTHPSRPSQPGPPHESLAVHLRGSLERSSRTVLWLARIMIPASALVFALERSGALAWLARPLEPVMGLLGLPGAAAVALLSSILVNLYAVIAMLPVLGLDVQQLTVLALLCLVAHNFLVELAVMRRTGTPMPRMFVVRLAGGLLVAGITARLIPDSGFWLEPVRTAGLSYTDTAALALGPALRIWAVELGRLMLRVALLVSALVFVSRALQYLGLTDKLGALVAPPLRLMGLPRASAPAWIVANTLGLAYGAAVLAEEAASGRLSPADGDLLNHHLGVSHSLLEDTALFAALGVPGIWLVAPRLALAVVVVWERRLERYLTGRICPRSSSSGQVRGPSTP